MPLPISRVDIQLFSRTLAAYNVPGSELPGVNYVGEQSNSQAGQLGSRGSPDQPKGGD
jgi:hypothetical protein